MKRAKPSFMAYPNPTNSQLNIQFEDASMVESLQLINSVRQVVYTSMNPNNDFQQIDLNSFADGIYYLSIYSENERISRKVVLRK